MLPSGECENSDSGADHSSENQSDRLLRCGWDSCVVNRREPGAVEMQAHRHKFMTTSLDLQW